MATQPPTLYKTQTGRWAFRANIHLSEQMFDFELNPGHGEYEVYPSRDLMAFLQMNDPDYEYWWHAETLTVVFSRPDVEVAFRMRFDAKFRPALTLMNRDE